MRPVSTGEMARMAGVQESAMLSRVEILEGIETGTDAWNKKTVMHQLKATSVCGFDTTNTQEVMDTAEVVTIDAVARLPLALDGTVVNTDRIRLVELWGSEVPTPLSYEIVGQPERGPSALVLNLKLVTDGS